MKKLYIIIISALLMCGCADSRMYSKDIFAMDTYMTLRACGSGAEDALSACSDEIKRLEELFSVTMDGSDISRINSAGGQPVSVDGDTADIIRASADIGRVTGGALNIALYPISREWGFTTGEYAIPSAERISALLENTDTSLISVSGGSVTVPEGTELDLGAVAKGYTAGRLDDILRSHGVKSAIISLGGNVQTVGSRPDGSPWQVGIADPFSPAGEIAAIKLRDKAAVTSGSYQRYFDGEDGKRYCHIIDPSSGYPADSGLVSVTVIGEDGFICDALSTALFVMGRDGAVRYYNENGGFDMVIITAEGDIFVTAGIKDSLTVRNGYHAEVIE